MAGEELGLASGKSARPDLEGVSSQFYGGLAGPVRAERGDGQPAAIRPDQYGMAVERDVKHPGATWSR